MQMMRTLNLKPLSFSEVHPKVPWAAVRVYKMRTCGVTNWF